jgi:4,5-dihydroxyphthalate decarboxylase
MSTATDGPALHVKTVFGDYPHTLPIKDGAVRSPRLDLDFTVVKPTNRAFMPMVRELKFDVCEMAIVTFLQAKAYGKPLILIPCAMLSRFQHGLIVYNAARGEMKPTELSGRRIGVRAYSQTTGAWVRGILTNHYGVDLSGVHWVTFEDAHVAEYKDPPGVERAGPDQKLEAMLLAGELDAAIGEFAPDPRLRPLFPDPAAEAQKWYERTGTVPVNHMVVVAEAVARANPWLPGEVYRLLSQGKASAGLPKPGSIDMIPFGFEANRKTLEMIIDFIVQQGLIPQRLKVDDLIDETTRTLTA